MTQPKRILLIGGTRFIGPYVAAGLVELGHSVTVYHRGHSEATLPASVQHVRHSAAAMPVREFPAELFGPRPEIVIHMIPMGEEDAQAALQAFRGHAERIVWLSSGDVYRAYGGFAGLEPAPIDNSLLTEDSPLRSVLYPYRAKAQSVDELFYYYEKILVERIALSHSAIESTVLRLPKVYGRGDNADLGTVYSFRKHLQWRWTHGYVENVAAAVVLAALHPAAKGKVYNVGEEYTPSIGERLAYLPESSVAKNPETRFNFDHNIAHDTSRIRRELGYREKVPEREAALNLLQGGLLRSGSCDKSRLLP